ncbi:protein kinase [Streptomyces malaysiensis subsp. malaysiensis]|uniref:serine/threonine protein kinase n=1 Tax=Streptomyces malaysiensis TaxID=92644 RepID=UPI0024C052F5|nr:serine/threonine protein kinase [Streptomyces sp. NA07423]WHX18570.1 protein kinase [Streptomyces sp. NA07423]
MHIAPLSPEDPTELGGYELLGRIGHGGMGQVYLGESPGGEPAAVKVIKPSVVDSETRQRFAQEVEILKTVWGARIAALLDADVEADPPWLATEYVEGLDLSRHVGTHGPLSSLLTASLGATLAEALATVHKQGLLHRDLKPANVLLGPNGPKIIDFGLAVFAESSVSLTSPNTVVGTPSCMPPEQANGERPLTPAVDVYALGAVLLFAASGHLPYRADNIHVLFHQIIDPTAAPDLSGTPEELVQLLTAMLAHQAQDRPPLDDVVRQCRALIEAQGLKVAQARRRLTSYTAAPAHVLDELLAVPRPGTSSKPPAETADAPPGRQQSVPPSADPGHPERTSADAPAASATGRTDQAAGRVEAPGQTPARPASGPKGRGDSGRRSLRHSAQARITAQRLREAYAASTPF